MPRLFSTWGLEKDRRAISDCQKRSSVAMRPLEFVSVQREGELLPLVSTDQIWYTDLYVRSTSEWMPVPSLQVVVWEGKVAWPQECKVCIIEQLCKIQLSRNPRTTNATLDRSMVYIFLQIHRSGLVFDPCRRSSRWWSVTMPCLALRSLAWGAASGLKELAQNRIWFSFGDIGKSGAERVGNS